MIDVQKLLYDICEDKRVYEDSIDLIDSGILDSYAFIELFSRLEDYGIILHPTRIDITKLRTVHGIEELIEQSQHSKENNI